MRFENDTGGDRLLLDMIVGSDHQIMRDHEDGEPWTIQFIEDRLNEVYYNQEKHRLLSLGVIRDYIVYREADVLPKLKKLEEAGYLELRKEYLAVEVILNKNLLFQYEELGRGYP